MENNNKDLKDMDYTVVLDRNYRGPVIEAEQKKQEAEAANAVPEPEIEFDAGKAEAEKIYETYESMFIKDYTALDKDDIYPHTYQWRLGDKYDAGKAPVLEEAIKKGVRIADTEAYEKYIQEVKSRKFEPDSWD